MARALLFSHLGRWVQPVSVLDNHLLICIQMTLDLATLKTGGRYLHGKNGQPVTLGYIGSLPPESPTTSQLWLGIEYDDSTFGKHSGEFQGAPVFQTRIAGAGAFIRYSQGALKRGRTFTEAFQDRYGPLDPSHAPPTADRAQADMAVTLGVSGIVVEAPGMSEVTKRIGKLEKLREISVENEWVDAVGGDESLHAIMRQRLRGEDSLVCLMRQKVAHYASRAYSQLIWEPARWMVRCCKRR